MADILEHPDALAWQERFGYNEGNIIIESADKKPLMAYQCIAMLEQTKHALLQALMNK